MIHQSLSATTLSSIADFTRIRSQDSSHVAAAKFCIAPVAKITAAAFAALEFVAHAYTLIWIGIPLRLISKERYNIHVEMMQSSAKTIIKAVKSIGTTHEKEELKPEEPSFFGQMRSRLTNHSLATAAAVSTVTLLTLYACNPSLFQFYKTYEQLVWPIFPEVPTPDLVTSFSILTSPPTLQCLVIGTFFFIYMGLSQSNQKKSDKPLKKDLPDMTEVVKQMHKPTESTKKDLSDVNQTTRTFETPLGEKFYNQYFIKNRSFQTIANDYNQKYQPAVKIKAETVKNLALHWILG